MGDSTPRNEPLLWENQNPTASYMWEFMQIVNKKYKKSFKSYQELHAWSVENPPQFWEEVWVFTGVRAVPRPLNKGSNLSFEQNLESFETRIKERSSVEVAVEDYDSDFNIKKPFQNVVDPKASMFPRPNFFDGCMLNFADNLLHPRDAPNENQPAMISVTESTVKSITWRAMREKVLRLALAMNSLGIQPCDRVAGFLGNHADTVIAMLATTYLGAIWTAVSPDTGVVAVLDRLVQIEPVLLFADNAVEYNGKIHESVTKTRGIAEALRDLKAVVIFETVPGFAVDLKSFNVANGQAWTYDAFVKDIPIYHPDLLRTLRVTFSPSSPLYILYSSGTTGKPKCIVHSAAGTLIQHKKEHVLQCDIRPGDRLLYYTTTSWMMWHWLVAGLSSAATIILYDGSPFKPHSNLTMPKLISSLRVTHFGTSAKYLSVLEQNQVFPLKQGIELSSLKAIYSTGSPLAPSTFRYVYNAFPSTINLGSITGGTDIISLFGAPSPISPVYEGEIQVKGLGMDICAFDPEGNKVADGEPGDLVCLKPFPSQPVGFWPQKYVEVAPLDDGDPSVFSLPQYDAARYKSSYFDTFPGVWHHGDFVRFNPKTGGMVMLGRSDGVLKPAGVRFGSAEIYNVLLKHFSTEVEDSLCIGQRRETDSDERVVLFLKMLEGKACSAELKVHISAVIREELSARHVPAVIDQCFEIPVTTNGKKIEVAVKQILCGMNVKTSASVANADCLDWYRNWASGN